MTDFDLAHLERWVGNEVVTKAVISAETANLMAAALDRKTIFNTGDQLPPGWHWLYFHEPVKASSLGKEGLAERGDFLPPIPLPRRMWAGGRLNFTRPLFINERAIKRSTVRSVTPKRGRSGQLCFVIVEHKISVEGALCLQEEQTIVYREAARPGEQVLAQVAALDATESVTYHPNPVLLFRYSALTFNGHRIHYDVDYCRNVEGYPDLVVHGPLIATLLLDLGYHRYSKKIETFEYKALSPLFNPQSFTINGRREGNRAHIWAANHEGGLAMDATVELATAAKFAA